MLVVSTTSGYVSFNQHNVCIWVASQKGVYLSGRELVFGGPPRLSGTPSANNTRGRRFDPGCALFYSFSLFFVVRALSLPAALLSVITTAFTLSKPSPLQIV